MAPSGSAHNVSHANCWNTGCSTPGWTCFVRDKGAKGGYAQCHRQCPSGWNCETRTAEGHCGAAHLPATIQSASPEARALLSPYKVAVCDRRQPPSGSHPTFTMECFDGGFTGNRYLMVMSMLRRAICCAGVALLPPSFDGMPDSGVHCLDFRGRQPLSNSSASCASTSTNSAAWWSKLPKHTPAVCNADADTAILMRIAAALYAGFGLSGSHALGSECPSYLLQPDTLVMHVRSGDLFTSWKDGARTFNHSGYNSEMGSRGQPPLGFYYRVMAHALPADPHRPSTVVLVTSPDLASPVVRALKHQAQMGALRPTLRLSASESFHDDLQVLLCARKLVLADSTLTSLLTDSPRLERAYRFQDSCNHQLNALPRCPFAPSWCTSATNCAHGHQVESWCIQPGGPYSVASEWRNSDEQQVEMLIGGNASEARQECQLEPSGSAQRGRKHRHRS